MLFQIHHLTLLDDSAGVCLQCTGLWRLALAGGIAGCCFWTAMFPTDVVKSRIQVRQCWVTCAQHVFQHVFQHVCLTYSTCAQYMLNMCSACAQYILNMCSVHAQHVFSMCMATLRTALGCKLPLLELLLSTTKLDNHCQSVSDVGCCL